MSIPMNEPTQGPGRPTNESEAADTQIQLRVTKSRKGAYVKASRKAQTTLAAWIFAACDQAANYKPK